MSSEYIKEMARLAILSNKITEFHEKNLKMFPLVFFNDVKEAKLNYDLRRQKTVEDEPDFCNSRVTYNLSLDESTNDHLPKRFEALETSVRGLFWNDIVVEIFFNGKIVFKSNEDGK